MLKKIRPAMDFHIVWSFDGCYHWPEGLFRIRAWQHTQEQGSHSGFLGTQSQEVKPTFKGIINHYQSERWLDVMESPLLSPGLLKLPASASPALSADEALERVPCSRLPGPQVHSQRSRSSGWYLKWDHFMAYDPILLINLYYYSLYLLWWVSWTGRNW